MRCHDICRLKGLPKLSSAALSCDQTNDSSGDSRVPRSTNIAGNERTSGTEPALCRVSRVFVGFNRESIVLRFRTVRLSANRYDPIPGRCAAPEMEFHRDGLPRRNEVPPSFRARVTVTSERFARTRSPPEAPHTSISRRSLSIRLHYGEQSSRARYPVRILPEF